MRLQQVMVAAASEALKLRLAADADVFLAYLKRCFTTRAFLACMHPEVVRGR